MAFITGAGFFWHITDLHYDSLYSTTGDTRKNCWHTDTRGSSGYHRPRGKYGDYACDSPWALIESAAHSMRMRQGDSVEFVLWTGDAISRALWKTDESLRLTLLRNLTELFSRTFSSQFVFPVLGHEEPDTFEEMKELWQHWLPTEALMTFEAGGYYTIEQSHSKLRIIALNTNLMLGGKDKHRPDDKETALMNRQWEWLEKIFIKSKQNGEMVYIVGHVPPGADERQGGAPPLPQTSFSEENNKRYLRLVRKFHGTIAGQFFGHLHSDSFRIMYNDLGKPISWAMLAPSVTPRHTSGGANNPGFRLYKFDSDRGQVLDYTQYYLDIGNANRVGEAEWLPEYNLTNYYGLQDISATSLHNLVDRFTQDRPSANYIFSKYFRANSVRMHDSPNDAQCESACSHAHYCAITRVDYSEFKKCVDTAASALASSKSDILLSWSIITILCILIGVHAILE
ncbi:acid sphingomyelinase-like phosphodiesterase 3b [Arctopsyche grandis]|uniref:acid sphingomyelinase-like phosphodiesterase 3b n=1 Tax=Arctopsyche grandis TaxID=121162 RepID=UPI00406D90E8